jgi:hypothetical protein
MSYIGKNVAPQPQGTYSQSEIDTQMLTKSPTDSPVFTGNLTAPSATITTGNLLVGATHNGYGKITITGSSANDGINAWIRNTSDAPGDNVKYAGIQFSVGSDDGSTAIRSYRTNSGYDYQSALAFLTKGVGVGATDVIERVRITASGNVGIGTTNPTAKLDVNGTANFNGIVTMPNQPAFSAQQSDGTISIIDSEFISLICDQTVYNTGNYFSPGNGRFTAPVTGTYYMYATVAWQSAFTSTHGRLQLSINGASDNYQNCQGIYQRIQGTGSYFRMFVSHVMRLSAGDFVKVQVIQDSGETQTLRRCMTEFSGYLIG